MGLIKTSIELLKISEDMRRRFYNDSDYDKGELYDFDQTWGSTALGFPGVGGSAMTTARTYVFIPYKMNVAYVYFGSRFAYECDINDEFKKDLQNQKMADVMHSDKYKIRSN